MVSGELDLGIVTMPLQGAAASELMSVASIEDELLLIVPEGRRLWGTGRYAWSDLAGEPMVLFEDGSAVRGIIDLESREAGVALSVVMEVQSAETIERMIGACIGPGLISRFALGGRRGLICSDGRLIRLLAVVRRRDRVPSAASAVFERVLLSEWSGHSRP